MKDFAIYEFTNELMQLGGCIVFHFFNFCKLFVETDGCPQVRSRMLPWSMSKCILQ